MSNQYPALRDRAIELRVQQRLSDWEIWDRVGRETVVRSTIHRWLKEHPLTDEEKQTHRSNRQKAAQRHRASFYKSLPVSACWENTGVSRLTTLQKGRIAEAAVTFRCVLHGHAVFVSPFDGDTADRIVQLSSGNLIKLQIRWCKRQQGSPGIRLTSNGNNGVTRGAKLGDFDFLVGYDLRTDKAFVFSWDEVKALTATVAVTEESMEAFHKLQ